MRTRILASSLLLTALLAACGQSPRPQPAAAANDPAVSAQSSDQEIDTIATVYQPNLTLQPPTQEASVYLQQAGAGSLDDLVETVKSDNFCTGHLQKSYFGGSKFKRCIFTAPPGYAIFDASINVVENFKGRGNVSPTQIYAAGQTFSYDDQRLEERKRQIHLAIELALKNNDSKAVADLQNELRRLDQVKLTFQSSHNTVTADLETGGAFMTRSWLTTTGSVTLIRMK